MIVVDSNVLAARAMTGDKTELAMALEREDPVWVVPRLWRYEFQNILTTTVKVRLLSVSDALAVWKQTFDLLANNEYEPAGLRVLETAARLKISAYDANFIVLAEDLSVDCVTEDVELQKKRPDLAFGMRQFLSR